MSAEQSIEQNQVAVHYRYEKEESRQSEHVAYVAVEQQSKEIGAHHDAKEERLRTPHIDHRRGGDLPDEQCEDQNTDGDVESAQPLEARQLDVS